MFAHAIFSMAFARQVAVPAIGAVLDRGGTGLILTQTRKRNRDTLLFFSELFRYGDDEPRLRALVARLAEVHASHAIDNDLYLYTLATLACEPARASSRLARRSVIEPPVERALYVLWRRIGELLGIRDIPGDEHELLRWMLEYERMHYVPTEGGKRVTRALAREFSERWFPRWARSYGESFFFALFDEPLRAAHEVRPSPFFASASALLASRLFLEATEALPDPGDRRLADSFGEEP